MKIQVNPQSIWADVQAIKKQSPLIHNITNYVSMEHSANSLLAIGASPVMSHALEEVEDMVNIAHGLVINIGTLSPLFVEAVMLAIKKAKVNGIPIILDPVGCGATSYRTKTAEAIIETDCLTAVKGNASEIAALFGKQNSTKGVDSTLNPVDCISKAKTFSLKRKNIIVISGPTDVVTNGRSVFLIHNGHFLMGKVTGMGCIATAIIASFLAINKDPFIACVHAMCVMGIAGESAAQVCTGVGSFKISFLDSLFNLSLANIQKSLRIERL